MIGGGLYNIYIIIYIYIYYIVSLNFPHRNETTLAIVDLQGKVDLQQLSQRMADGASWCQEVPPDADMTGIAKAAAALLGKMSCTWDSG